MAKHRRSNSLHYYESEKPKCRPELTTYPLKMNAEDIYNEIRETILSIAKADRKKAEIKVKTLEIRYQYTPKEDSCPIAKWKKNWGKIVKYINGEMELTFKDFKDTPFLSHPRA